MSVAAMIAIRRRRMIRRYRQAGATDSLHARRPEDLKWYRLRAVVFIVVVVVLFILFA